MVYRSVYLLSLCLNKIDHEIYSFHFKGVYLGHEITSIVISGSNFKKNNEYLIELNVEKVDKKVLYGRVLNYKLINSHLH
jgi:hypothetical protein